MKPFLFPSLIIFTELAYLCNVMNENITDKQTLNTQDRELKQGMLKVQGFNGGRPALFTDPVELQGKVDAYMQKCEEEKIVPTIAEMAFFLGIDRQQLYSYHKKDAFSYIIEKARQYIFGKQERRLANTNTNAGGLIFLAKNYGYNDRQEIEFTKPLLVEVKDYTGRQVLSGEAQDAEYVEEPDQTPEQLPPSEPTRTEEKTPPKV